MKGALTVLILFQAVIGSLVSSHAQGTAFTYQGRLNASGVPANGTYDLQFTVYDSAGGANVVAGPLTGSGVPVTNGLFTVTLDFGTGVFTGPARWLQIGVRTNGGGSFVPLNPRQALTPAPYAIFAATASNVVSGSVVKSVNGLKDNVTLAAGANVTLTPSGNTITIASTGGGVGETNSLWSLNGNNAYYNAGNIGIGTSTPTEKLTIAGVASYNTGLKLTGNSDNGVGLALENSSAGGHKYAFLSGGLNTGVGPGGLGIFDDTLGYYPFAISATGNVGIGTPAPQFKLQVEGDEFLRGNAYFGEQGRQMLNLFGTGFGIGIQTATVYSRSGGGFTWFLGGTHTDTTYDSGGGTTLMTLDAARGLDFGSRGGQHLNLWGALSPRSFGFGIQTETLYARTGNQGGDGFAWYKGGTHNDGRRNPGGGQTLMMLDEENGLAISGNATQAREKGGWVKAMAKVNADGSIARQYSAFGGNITVSRVLGAYAITFPFQVDDRFVSVSPFDSLSAGAVVATIDGRNCASCTAHQVVVLLTPLINPGVTADSDFFIFVY